MHMYVFVYIYAPASAQSTVICARSGEMLSDTTSASKPGMNMPLLRACVHVCDVFVEEVESMEVW